MQKMIQPLRQILKIFGYEVGSFTPETDRAFAFLNEAKHCLFLTFNVVLPITDLRNYGKIKKPLAFLPFEKEGVRVEANFNGENLNFKVSSLGTINISSIPFAISTKQGFFIPLNKLGPLLRFSVMAR